MMRYLAAFVVVLALVVSSGCGPFTIVLPGGATPTLTSTPTPIVQMIVVTATPTATSTPAPAAPTATPIIAPTVTTAPPTVTKTPVPAAPTNTPTVAPPTAAVPKADLYISEMSLTPASPRQGESVAVRVGVYNGGNAPAGAFIVEWWAASAAKGCSWDVTSLVAKGGRILTCTYTYPGWSNSYTVRAVADSGSAVAESDEANNTRTLDVQVQPALVTKPNLIISDLKVTPASPKMGVGATFAATVYNDGNAASPASHVEIWAASAALACTKVVDALPAKGGLVITCAYTYGGWSNAYAVRAVADSASEVNESNETDNTKTITVAVQP